MQDKETQARLVEALKMAVPLDEDRSSAGAATRSTSGIKYALDYHIVICTKYRRPVLADINRRLWLGKFIGEKAKSLGAIVRRGSVGSEHVHLLVSVPPTLALSTFVGALKGYSSRRLREVYPELTGDARSLWSSGSYIAAVGQHSTKRVAAYIDAQREG